MCLYFSLFILFFFNTFFNTQFCIFFSFHPVLLLLFFRHMVLYCSLPSVLQYFSNVWSCIFLYLQLFYIFLLSIFFSTRGLVSFLLSVHLSCFRVFFFSFCFSVVVFLPLSCHFFMFLFLFIYLFIYFIYFDSVISRFSLPIFLLRTHGLFTLYFLVVRLSI